MGHEQSPKGFKDFLKGRQNRLTPAMEGVPGEIIRKSPILPDPKKAHISQITKTKPQTDVPFTPDEAKEIRRKHEKDQRRRSKIATAGKVALAGTAVVGGTGAIGYITVPAIHQSVDQFAAKHWGGVGVSAQTGEIDANFEATPSEIAKKFPIIIPKDSFTPVAASEIPSIWEEVETVDDQNHTFTTGFTISQEDLARAGEIRHKSVFDRSLFAGVAKETIDQMEQAGIKNREVISGFVKGTKFGLNFDSEKFDASIIKVATAGETKGNFTPAYTTLRVMLRHKEDGKSYSFNLHVLQGKPLVEPAPYPKGHRPVVEDGTKIDPSSLFIELTTDLQDWDGSGQILPGQEGQIVITGMGESFDLNLLSINFFNAAVNQ